MGNSIGKTHGYTILGKFMANVWKCNATLHIHDSGWLVFHFSSAANMGRVLCKGPYSVQGKSLVKVVKITTQLVKSYVFTS